MIATRLTIKPSTITPLVKRLEAAGLAPEPGARMMSGGVVVTLTARGLELRTNSRCLGEALFARSGMATEEMIALNREVRRLHQALTDKGSET